MEEKYYELMNGQHISLSKKFNVNGSLATLQYTVKYTNNELSPPDKLTDLITAISFMRHDIMVKYHERSFDHLSMELTSTLYSEPLYEHGGLTSRGITEDLLFLLIGLLIICDEEKLTVTFQWIYTEPVY